MGLEDRVRFDAPEAACASCALSFACHFNISALILAGAGGVAMLCAHSVLYIFHDKVVFDHYINFHAILLDNYC